MGFWLGKKLCKIAALGGGNSLVLANPTSPSVPALLAEANFWQGLVPGFLFLVLDPWGGGG